ncbi:hypothetical protein BDW59DRAFT_72455 [Aspergillus cavernicola]|uniref:Uncharacterized protein n=1 Tax=Aspergillus cavernicola TaxID=176166 RepID=A0ABR4IEZ0_9EURO
MITHAPKTPQTTVLKQSINLFRSIVDLPCFINKTICLLLDNLGLFKRKLSKPPLALYFPTYTGGTDAIGAMKYVLRQFQAIDMLLGRTLEEQSPQTGNSKPILPRRTLEVR